MVSFHRRSHKGKTRRAAVGADQRSSSRTRSPRGANPRKEQQVAQALSPDAASGTQWPRNPQRLARPESEELAP